MCKELTKRIEDLESQLAFQDDTIEQMSIEMAAQQQTIGELLVKIDYLAGKIRNIDGSNLADASEETPPPHY